MSQEVNNAASNKLAIIHVLAALIKNPLLFANNNYSFSIEDFPEQFHKILFGAIEYLAKKGMEKIDYIDIDQFLKQYTVQYKVFCNNKGVEYIQNALNIYDEKKFDYYYQTLKKYSLINNLKAEGIDTRDIYDPDIVDPVESARMYENFDALSINDILLKEETKIILAKEKYGSNSDRVENKAGDGLRELKERFKQTPEMGLPLVSPKLTTIVRGQRRGCLFLESAPSGYGKALPNSSRIPTTVGWKNVQDIKVGDYLFDAKGHPTKVLGVYPQGKQEVYQITFRDGRTCRCSDEHLWSYNSNGQRIKSVEDRIFYTKTLKEIMNDKPLRQNGEYTILVPQQQALEYSPKQHFLPPYILGLLLGDGCLKEQESNKGLEFSSANEELPSIIGNTMNWSVKKHKTTYAWTFSFNNLSDISSNINRKKGSKNVWVRDALKEHPDLINTNSQTKFIPRVYLEDSIDNRFELLNGLLDTDGCVDKRGRVSFFTISPQLRDDVTELAQSLGFSTSIFVDTHKSTNIGYLVQIMGSPELKNRLFKLSLKRQKMQSWYEKSKNNKGTHKHRSNPMIKIEDLGYQEDMTCFLVDNNEHLFLTENFIVTHNTRIGNSEACHLAIPEYYDVQRQAWIKTNMQESVLVISTELEENECQQMWMAFVGGVPENHIKDGRYAPGEEERVDRAIELIEQSNLYFVSITNYDVNDIINIIKKYKQLYNVNYVIFDYLGETLKITSSAARQTKVQGLRTDQILLMFSSALKDAAKTLGIYIWTASQLSGDYKNAKDLDASYLRSAKSLADKVDVGCILMPVREIDQSIIDSYCARGFELAPNFVINIYKVRAGSYQNIKLYGYFDRSVCQWTDCFVTDSKGIILPIEDTNIEILLDSTKEEKFENAYTGTSDEDDDIGFDF